MKALVKVAPIVVILACAASLFFSFKLSGIKTGLENDKQDLTTKIASTEASLSQTKDTLARTETDLAQSRNETTETKAQLDAEKVKLAQKSREAEDLTAQVARLESDVKAIEEAKAETEKTLENIKQAMKDVGMSDLDDIVQIREKIEAITGENKVLGEKLAEAANTIAAKDEELRTLRTTPADLRGQVVLAENKWNFVVLDMGKDKHVQENSHFILYRDSQLVGKAQVKVVYQNSCIAQLDPDFTKSAPKAGDIAIYEKM